MKTALIIASLFVLALPTAFAETAVKESEWTVSKTDLTNPIKGSIRGFTTHITTWYDLKDKNAPVFLKKAEATYPKREVVLNAMKEAHFKIENIPTDQDLWWSSAFDGVKIPYAVTAASVNYYDALITAWNKGDFSGSNGLKMQTASLKYSSEIEYHDKWSYIEKKDEYLYNRDILKKEIGREFKDVYVAELDLEWSQYCGGECAMMFHVKRFVIMDKNGNVVDVLGDGNVGVIVS